MKKFDPKCFCGHRRSQHHQCAGGTACCMNLWCEETDRDHWLGDEGDPRCHCGPRKGGYRVNPRSPAGRKSVEKKRGRAPISG